MTDWDKKERGEPVRRARGERDDLRGRTAAEVRALREDAARSARLCADCFEPLSPSASVTMVRRPVLIPARTSFGHYYPEHRDWIRVPICLTCWLINLQRGVLEGKAQDHHDPWAHLDQHEIERRRLRDITRYLIPPP
jgi:hypothetical protein